MLADADLDLLRRVITPQQPCGPPDAAQFTGSVALLRLLYDPTNRIHRHAEGTGAPYVIGRKGAGKTAFVTAPRLHDEVVAVELPTADIYQGVFGIVTSLMRRELHLYPEHTARLWRHVAWSAVLAAIAQGPQERRAAYRRVRDFAQSLGNGSAPPPDAGAAVSQYLRRLRVLIDSLDHLGGVGELLNSVEANGLTMAEAIEAGSAVLAERPERYVVIVDSLERYSGELPTTEYQQVERISFEGLFRFIGGDGTLPTRAFDIRFAFPAEMWQVLARVSSNPVKDFHSTVIAHWSSRELITLVGTRLAIYCHLHQPDLLEELELPEDPAEMSYVEGRQLIDAVLPAEVINAFGGREDAVAFLLRHTQLLPRHLIALLNQVFEAHAVDPRAPFPVSRLAVLEGVRRPSRRSSATSSPPTAGSTPTPTSAAPASCPTWGWWWTSPSCTGCTTSAGSARRPASTTRTCGGCSSRSGAWAGWSSSTAPPATSSASSSTPGRAACTWPSRSRCASTRCSARSTAAAIRPAAGRS
ncbi:MAG TPA: hypothetical protein VKB57_17240 [Acidimicrobiales bacterium]|nr:hypothetical protein [Acidimicrobiales bacterium]